MYQYYYAVQRTLRVEQTYLHKHLVVFAANTIAIIVWSCLYGRGLIYTTFWLFVCCAAVPNEICRMNLRLEK